MAVEKEPEGKYLDAGGLKLHYHEFGAGFPVICIVRIKSLPITAEKIIVELKKSKSAHSYPR